LNDLWKFDRASSQWTWLAGDNTYYCIYFYDTRYCWAAGAYGTQGTPAVGNTPGGRYSMTSWTDSKGNFWLFGGFGVVSATPDGFLNDVWRYSPSSNEWAWMGGANFNYFTGVYGTLGTPSVDNIPGGRIGAVSWDGSEGSVHLLGGFGIDGSADLGYLNDFWAFNSSRNEWTWEGGSSVVPEDSGLSGTYGTLDRPSATNLPGGRYHAVTWSDREGNLWLFGGWGFDANGQFGYLNDLWEYDHRPRFP
jgi:N-acetylneuraminic acid mutarotase